MFFRKLITAGVFAALSATAAQAATIIGYDIFNANQSGDPDIYDGTLRGSADGIPGLVDYVGGSGALNDGLLPAGRNGSQLFFGRNVLENLSITLHFDRAIRLGTLEFLTSQEQGNTSRIAGSLLEVTAIGGGGDFFATIGAEGFGPIGRSGEAINERFDFSGTDFAEIELDSITLTNFFASPVDGFRTFSASEITVTEAQVAPVPLPASGLLMVAGIGGLIAARRRKKAS